MTEILLVPMEHSDLDYDIVVRTTHFNTGAVEEVVIGTFQADADECEFVRAVGRVELELIFKKTTAKRSERGELTDGDRAEMVAYGQMLKDHNI